MSFYLPPQVDPNHRTAPGDPWYGLNAFKIVWHDLWWFFTQVAKDLYTTFRYLQSLSDKEG